MVSSGTISQQEDLKAMTTNGQSSSEIVDIPLNQIPSDPEKVLENFDPGISNIYSIKNWIDTYLYISYLFNFMTSYLGWTKVEWQHAKNWHPWKQKQVWT